MSQIWRIFTKCHYCVSVSGTCRFEGDVMTKVDAVELAAAIIAIASTTWTIVNAIYNRTFSRFNAFTAKRRDTEISRMYAFFKNVQEARGSNQQRQMGLHYAQFLITNGRSQSLQGTVVYAISLTSMLILAAIPNVTYVTKYYLSLLLILFTLLLLGLVLILMGQRGLRRGADILHAMAASPKFLDKAAKRLSQLTASKSTNLERLDEVRLQIEDARQYHGVNWPHTKL